MTENEAFAGPSKQTMRTKAIAHRKRIDPFSEDFEQAITLFYEKLEPQAGQIVGLYWPKDKEFDTRGLMHQLMEDGVTCALPVMQDSSRMLVFRTWEEGQELAAGPYDIMQPTGGRIVIPDILVVPLLAFDRRGHRLGYGGGYYDTTITALRAEKADIQIVGYCYAQQAVLFNLPAEDHDAALDWIITPAKAHKFGD